MCQAFINIQSGGRFSPPRGCARGNERPYGLSGRAGGALGMDAGEPKRKHASCLHVFGHRTMRQGSKLTLFAANLRRGRKVRPCPRPSGAQGGDVFWYRRGKGKTKDPRRLPRAFCFGLIIQKCNFCHFYISYRYSSQTVR